TTTLSPTNRTRSVASTGISLSTIPVNRGGRFAAVNIATTPFILFAPSRSIRRIRAFEKGLRRHRPQIIPDNVCSAAERVAPVTLGSPSERMVGIPTAEKCSYIFIDELGP